MLLRPAHPERRTDRPTLKNERASSAARTARPKKATKPFTGIVAAGRPSRQLDRRRFRCGLRHVALPPVPPYHHPPQNGRGIGTLDDEAPEPERGTTIGQPTARGTTTRSRGRPRRSALAGRQHAAEQERDAAFLLRPGAGVEFDGLEQGALHAVAVLGEVAADEFGRVAGGGVGDDA